MPVTNKTFETLSCHDFEDGQRLLIADYSIDCDSSEHGIFRLLAITSTLLFVIGQPVCLLVILVLGKLAHGDDQEGQQGARAPQDQPEGALETTFQVLSEVRAAAVWRGSLFLTRVKRADPSSSPPRRTSSLGPS